MAICRPESGSSQAQGIGCKASPDVARGVDGDDAVGGLGSADVEGRDARVGVGAAQHRGIDHAGQDDVVGVFGGAAEQARIFAAADAGAKGFGAHRLTSLAASRTARTMFW